MFMNMFEHYHLKACCIVSKPQTLTELIKLSLVLVSHLTDVLFQWSNLSKYYMKWIRVHAWMNIQWVLWPVGTLSYGYSTCSWFIYISVKIEGRIFFYQKQCFVAQPEQVWLRSTVCNKVVFLVFSLCSKPVEDVTHVNREVKQYVFYIYCTVGIKTTHCILYQSIFQTSDIPLGKKIKKKRMPPYFWDCHSPQGNAPD